jgi:hypothetical protein
MIFSQQEQKAVDSLVEISLLSDPIFSPELFHTLAGVTSEEVSHILSNSEATVENDFPMRRLVFDVLNNLVNFPHRQSARIWSTTGLTNGHVRELCDRLRALGV